MTVAQPHVARAKFRYNPQMSNEIGASASIAVTVLDFLEKYNGALTAVATVFIAIFTIVLAIVTGRQARLTRQAINLARSEFISTHRPRVRIRNVALENPLPPERRRWYVFEPGQAVQGHLYVGNVGGSEAKITSSHCRVFWTKEPLPMERPYENETGNNFLGNTNLAAGASTIGTFYSIELIQDQAHAVGLGRDGWKLYVMGWVDYLDTNQTPRRTSFCREYRVLEGSGRGRLFPVEDNIDYENEE
jgi:hypothetical protein